MDGIPPALKTDSEDVVWALQTAEQLWRRGERVDAVVWLRRAAQAAGEGDDTKRAASLAKHAAALTDGLSQVPAAPGLPPPTNPRKKGAPGVREQSLEELDKMLGGGSIGDDAEIISSSDFEAGFRAHSEGKLGRGGTPSESEVMTISMNAPDVELVEDDDDVEQLDELPEEEPTPVRRSSPVPAAARPAPGVPSARDRHAGTLDPWAESEAARARDASAPARRAGFSQEEIATNAKGAVRAGPAVAPRPAALPPLGDPEGSSLPPLPKAPRVPVPLAKPPVRRPAVSAEGGESTTYRQVSPRSSREPAGPASVPTPGPVPRPVVGEARKRPAAPPLARDEVRSPSEEPTVPPEESTGYVDPHAPARITKPVSNRPPSLVPLADLLELADSVSIEPAPPIHSGAPTPRPLTPARSLPVSARPTAAPPSGVEEELSANAVPSSPPTRPNAGATLLDLGAVEALTDLPDEAREAFGAAAKLHAITKDEEVAGFALALIVDGSIDVAAQIVDAPALRLEKNAVLRSRGTLAKGIPLRLVCASEKAFVATWDETSVAAAFELCPWVGDELKSITDGVQAKAGVAMGPLGERFDMSLRDHLTSKLVVRALAPGETLVAKGKPVPLAIVGVGEIVLTKPDGTRAGVLGPGDFVFPAEILAHGAAPVTAAAGSGGAILLYGDRPVAQELLMSFPPLLEVLATI